ncbi:branched-chain amino acid ABC transporter [Philodulcilactobacillus myokoensis]|uniref:Branched-chain amino acid ABC transporter n=2 Tax=Philodulcilactobacillus myokoensis TaxID=2929573 RepID=A0A9W6B2K8_9LACO|nr:branched-chain amino acid ABC transporter [Philodulcilactobacillus myokoensis]
MSKRMLNDNYPMWLKDLRVSMPLNLSYIPIGTACGILLHAAGFNHLLTILVSILVFSGGAQFLIASMLLISSPFYSVILMLFFLELRYALLGSSLSKYLQGQSDRFTFFFAVSLNDENYAINYLKFSTDKKWTPKDALNVEHYSVLFWTISNLIGSFIGSALKIDLSLVNFALTALFLYMIMMQLKSMMKLLICVISIGLSIVFMVLMKSTLGLIISTVISSLIGFALENYLRNRHPKSNALKTFKNPAGTPKEN